MEESQSAFVEGTIAWEKASGFRVRVQYNRLIDGFLIIVWNPADFYSNDGGDYFVEKYEDLESFFKESGWLVKWDRPLAALLSD